MEFNKALRSLILSLPVIVIGACSSSRNISNEQSSEKMIGISTAIDSNEGGNIIAEDERDLTIQKVYKNNIIYFDLNRYNIRSEFTPILDVHAKFLSNNPSYRVIIEGHADERGTPEYNISLGERRSNAVKIYLQAKGVSSDQVSIISYGKEKPAVLGHNEAAYSKNRRAVLVY